MPLADMRVDVDHLDTLEQFAGGGFLRDRGDGGLGLREQGAAIERTETGRAIHLGDERRDLGAGVRLLRSQVVQRRLAHRGGLVAHLELAASRPDRE